MPYVILAAVIIHQALVIRRSKRLDPIAVETMIDAFVVVVFVYGMLTDPLVYARLDENYEYLWIVLGGLLALYAGLHWPWRDRKQGFRPEQLSRPLKNPIWLWCGLIFYCLSCLMILIGNAGYGGRDLWNSVLEERLSDYSMGLNIQGNIFYQFVTMMTCPTLILLGWMTNRKRWSAATVVYVLLLCGMVLIFRTRLSLILLLMLPLVYISERAKRFGYLLIPVAGAVSLVLLYYLDIWRHSGFTSAVVEPFSADNLSSQMYEQVNTLRALDWLVEMHQRQWLTYEYGLNYLYTLITFFPRSLWPGKPLTSFEARWTEQLTGMAMGSGVPAWTFTAWGEGLVQFGFPGVLLNLFLFGAIISLVKKRANHSATLFFAWFYYAALAATFLRSGFQSLAAFSALYWIPGLVCYRLSVGAKRRMPSKQPAWNLPPYVRAGSVPRLSYPAIPRRVEQRRDTT